jgi:hypothetical protein
MFSGEVRTKLNISAVNFGTRRNLRRAREGRMLTEKEILMSLEYLDATVKLQKQATINMLQPQPLEVGKQSSVIGEST